MRRRFSQIPLDEANDKFPAGQLAVLAEPVAFISIISYNFAMVEDIKGGDNIAFYAGLLVSAFAIAEASTAVLWGALSDKYGRKPIIITGLVGTALSSLVLGFARNYWVAFLARLLGGLLNGNVGVLQTMVAEIVKNPKHEPRAFSIQPFMWSLGSIAGSALGGYAAQPARFYPHYFSPEGMFGQFPYLLPNLIAMVAITLAIIQAAIFLKETNVHGSAHPDSTSPANATTPLLNNENTSEDKQRRRRPSFQAGSTPTITEPSLDLRRASLASITSQKLRLPLPFPEESIEEDDDDLDSRSSASSSTPSDKVLNKTTVMWIVALGLMCYHQMAFVSAFPIYVLDVPRTRTGLDLRGGLGMNVHDVGSYMAINSCVSLFIQGLILPTYVGKLGPWKSIVSLSILAPIVDMLFPFITAVPRRGLVLSPALALQTFCTIIIYPSMLIMLKDSVVSRSSLGYVNGLAVSASSAARTVAPPVLGMFYSTFGSAGAWWSCAIFALLAAAVLWFTLDQS